MERQPKNSPFPPTTSPLALRQPASTLAADIMSSSCLGLGTGPHVLAGAYLKTSRSEQTFFQKQTCTSVLSRPARMVWGSPLLLQQSIFCHQATNGVDVHALSVSLCHWLGLLICSSLVRWVHPPVPAEHIPDLEIQQVC